jgi:hypothetical protein
MSWKEGTKRLTIHFYPGTKRPDLGTKRPGYETFYTLPDYCAAAEPVNENYVEIINKIR